MTNLKCVASAKEAKGEGAETICGVLGVAADALEAKDARDARGTRAACATRRGTLFGVSVGPGDPELLTLKAVRVLREADVVAVPRVGAGRRQTAFGIVRDYLEGKPLIDCATPMTRDRTQAQDAYRVIADKIAAHLDAGRDVAYVCLGDVGVYSTYYYVHDLLVSRGYGAEVVPGVTSFCAAAARLGVPLCEGPEALVVAPVIAGNAKEAAMAVPGTKVFMKSGRELGQVRRLVEEAGRMESTSLVVNCGLDDEAVYRRFADVPGDMADYFTLVISRDPSSAGLSSTSGSKLEASSNSVSDSKSVSGCDQS